MNRWILATSGMILMAGILGTGCKEEMVGAPCVPETDKGNFNNGLSGFTYSIETRSVQCETRICLTKTEVRSSTQSDDCEADASVDTCWGDDPVQIKFSFCSCRCRDVAGHSFNTNPDKYDYLCECPPNTRCEDVLGDIAEAPDKVKGSYCVPNCIAIPCSEPGQICTPSKDSEKPWEWYCGNL